MRTKFAWLSAFLLLFVGQLVLAQVTGTVEDDFGPVPDAEITVRGSETVEYTDDSGYFTIDAAVGDVLTVVDPMGASQDFKVTRLNMGTMRLGVELLETVTIVGGVKMDAAQKVGAFDVVTKENFEMTPYSSVDDVLNGRVTGLTFSSASGDAGSSNMVIIRGVSSLLGSPNPLYVVDGVVIGKGADNAAMMESWNPLSAIDPNSIESVSVLKDASATALYGARGANGVIIIKTKTGKYKQKTRFGFSTEMAFQDRAFDKMKVMDGAEYIKYGGMLMWNSQGEGTFPGVFDNMAQATQYFLDNYEPNYTPGDPFTNWTDEVSRKTQVVKTYNFSAEGGGEKTTFRMGGSYYQNKPMVINSKFDRIAINSSMTHKANDKLNFGLNANYSNIKRNSYVGGRGTNNPINSAIMLSPLRAPFNADGTLNDDLGNTATQDYTPGSNPIGVMRGTRELSNINTFIASVNGEWEFAKNLYANSLFGIQYIDQYESRLTDTYVRIYTTQLAIPLK